MARSMITSIWRKRTFGHLGAIASCSFLKAIIEQGRGRRSMASRFIPSGSPL
jgi:hypothetical protein